MESSAFPQFTDAAWKPGSNHERNTSPDKSSIEQWSNARHALRQRVAAIH
jgi:hypothetical protein